nr:hypothetical protein [Frankia sp. ArI3]
MAQVAKIVDEVASLVGEPGIGDRLTVTGPADVLPSLYRVTTVATASVAAAAIGAGRLLAARTGGGPPDITLDTRHAGAAFRSERHLRIDGKAPPGPWDPISGYYRTADGRWIQLHCNFPHHRNGVLDLLGAPNDRAAVERVIRRVEAASLELELQAMGLCASMARAEPEWAEHRQARAVAELPLIEVSRLGDAPPGAVRTDGDAGRRPAGAGPDPRHRRPHRRAHARRLRRGRAAGRRGPPAGGAQPAGRHGVR